MTSVDYVGARKALQGLRGVSFKSLCFMMDLMDVIHFVSLGNNSSKYTLNMRYLRPSRVN